LEIQNAEGRSAVINPARWERVREEINFQDLVGELTGLTSHGKIRCPFHGTDSTPSFAFYPAKNNGWCFGCPPHEQFYDNVNFVAKHFAISKTKALLWLEKTNNLTAIPDVEDEQDEEEDTVTITFEDLAPLYIIQAAAHIQATQDVELAEDYIKRYFEAEAFGDTLALARVLEPATLERARNRKARA
jgi:DNA primase